MADERYDWLQGSYWYVPDVYLPALQALNGEQLHVRTLVDQTVWFFQYSRAGYLVGTSATNIGSGWSYMVVVGSVAPGGAVKLSFSPLGGAGGGNPPAPTIGDGALIEDERGPAFLMQMTSGTVAMNVTHWAYMRPVTPDDPAWSSLPRISGHRHFRPRRPADADRDHVTEHGFYAADAPASTMSAACVPLPRPLGSGARAGEARFEAPPYRSMKR